MSFLTGKNPKRLLRSSKGSSIIPLNSILLPRNRLGKWSLLPPFPFGTPMQMTKNFVRGQLEEKRLFPLPKRSVGRDLRQENRWRPRIPATLKFPMSGTAANTKRKSEKPSWLRAKLPSGPEYGKVRSIVDQHQLNSVCQSAQCPNMGECWSRGTATLMILGNVCTRDCSFCAVQTGKPTELDLAEPPRVADAVFKMGLKHCVLTSVARRPA